MAVQVEVVEGGVVVVVVVACAGAVGVALVEGVVLARLSAVVGMVAVVLGVVVAVEVEVMVGRGSVSGDASGSGIGSAGVGVSGAASGHDRWRGSDGFYYHGRSED